MRMMIQELPQPPKKLLYISVDLLECLVWYIVFRRGKMCDFIFLKRNPDPGRQDKKGNPLGEEWRSAGFHTNRESVPAVCAEY